MRMSAELSIHSVHDNWPP